MTRFPGKRSNSKSDASLESMSSSIWPVLTANQFGVGVVWQGEINTARIDFSKPGSADWHRVRPWGLYPNRAAIAPLRGTEHGLLFALCRGAVK